MPQFLVAIHHPDDFVPNSEGEATHRDIASLNRDMVAAGIRVFVGGLDRASKAKALRLKSDGKVIVSDGPYVETKEHIGGFWVLDVADMDEAVEWGRKAAIACRTPVEIRAFNAPPTR